MGILSSSVLNTYGNENENENERSTALRWPGLF
jgi:hypothetical protein